MKLNPPASSSDLDAARAIARRLHRRARGHERATDVLSDALATPDEVMAPVSPIATTASEPAPFEPTTPEPPPFEPAALEPTPVEPAPFEPAAPEPMPVEPAVPGSPLVEPTTPEPAAFEPEAAHFGAAPFEAPTDDDAPFQPPGDGETPSEVPDAPDAQPVEPPPSEPSTEHDGYEEAVSSSNPWASEATPAEGSTPWEAAPEEGAPSEIDPASAFGDLGVTEAGPALDKLDPPAGTGSPEELLGDASGPEWPEDNPLEAQIETEQESERAPADLVPPAATPSWDDVADSCRALARVHGAMIVDPSGQILAARGTWPEPGPEAIGGRLVSMMEKTLQDAPTRSVSAPLAGQHLTAWRVPASEGYYTVVFMGDAPLGADVRSPVDVEIKQALGQ